jgi:2-dehydro-3-deoxyphosphogluconate aldolase/(4S)-4-hydroxy-2-oxoglutarate aldolase
MADAPAGVAAESAVLGDGLIAVVRGGGARAALRTGVALAAGGVRSVELTFTTPEVLSVVAKLRDEVPAGTAVGVGTVRTAEQARAAAAAGAEFLVSPGGDARLVEAMLATGLPCLPGAMTPSEVASLLAIGVTQVKLFPASTVGPAHLRALRGPFPELAAVPSGGIGLGEVVEWFEAGAVAVAAGGEMIPAAAIAAEDWDRLRSLAGLWRRETVRAQVAD